MQNDFHTTMKRLSRDYQSTIAIDYQRLLNDYHIATIDYETFDRIVCSWVQSCKCSRSRKNIKK